MQQDHWRQTNVGRDGNKIFSIGSNLWIRNKNYQVVRNAGHALVKSDSKKRQILEKFVGD